MQLNTSPWLENKRKLEFPSIQENIETDVVIVGAGIAGTATTFFTLENTNLEVTLIDAQKIAEGATGHNAGIIVNSSERDLESMHKEFGEDMVTKSFKEIENGWELLDKIAKTALKDTKIHYLPGFIAFKDVTTLLHELKEHTYIFKNPETIYVVDKKDLQAIPADLKYVAHLITKKEFIEKFQIKPTEYRFVLDSSNRKRAVTNSSAMCKEVIEYLAKTRQEKLKVYENSHLSKINLEKDKATIECNNKQITCKKVVLCTNGYTNFDIEDKSSKFSGNLKQEITGYVDFMIGIRNNKDPRYIADMVGVNGFSEAYYYLSNRPSVNPYYKSFLSVGGPGRVDNDYSKDKLFPENYMLELKSFVDKNLNYKLRVDYQWHGLQGYTKNGLRWIGADPNNENLIYNLGCNGAGILSSIAGGYRVSKILSGEKLSKTIFDPPYSLIKSKIEKQ